MFGAEKLKRFLLQRNQHFRKVSVNKTFTHEHARAKKMDVVMTFLSNLKLPLCLQLLLI